jgi:hypothetical protein
MQDCQHDVTGGVDTHGERAPASAVPPASVAAGGTAATSGSGQSAVGQGRLAGHEVRLNAWRWAQDNRVGDGSLPSGSAIARHYGLHERWGRLVKRAGLAGDLAT